MLFQAFLTHAVKHSWFITVWCGCREQRGREACEPTNLVLTFRSRWMKIFAFKAWRQQSVAACHRRLFAARIEHLSRRYRQRAGLWGLRQFVQRLSGFRQRSHQLLSVLQMMLVGLKKAKLADAFAILRNHSLVSRRQRFCRAVTLVAGAVRRRVLSAALKGLLLHVRMSLLF